MFDIPQTSSLLSSLTNPTSIAKVAAAVSFLLEIQISLSEQILLCGQIDIITAGRDPIAVGIENVKRKEQNKNRRIQIQICFRPI